MKRFFFDMLNNYTYNARVKEKEACYAEEINHNNR